jgi:hypothetical protein
MAEASSPSTYSESGFQIDRLLVFSNSGGDGIDIASMDVFIELVVSESIFDDKLYGEILLRDTLNLSETLPIVGNERVEVTYRTPGTQFEPVTIKGFITAPMGKARADGEKTEVYVVQFVSETNFLNRFLVTEAAISGSITGMATAILRDTFDKTLNVNVQTSKKRSFVIPRWTPLFTISWLAERAFNEEQTSFYRFYEDVDGFHFKDILHETQKKEKYVFRVEPRNTGNLADVELYLTRVLDYSIASYFDKLDEFQGGMYSGVLNTHDITTKQYTQQDFDYIDYTNNPGWKSLNRYPLIPTNKFFDLYLEKGKSANRIYLPSQTKKMDGIQDNDNYGEYALTNRSLQKQFTTMRVTMLVPGNSSLRLLDTVGLQVPKIGYMGDMETDYLDHFITGKYIVVTLKHVLNRKDGYKTTVEMSKESLIKRMPDRIEKTQIR